MLPLKIGVAIYTFENNFRYNLELHSPLSNSSGLSTEARRPELELELSTHLSREHKSNTEHLKHLITVKSIVIMYTGIVEC